MERDKIRELLENVQSGKVKIEDALGKLKSLPYEDLGYALVDNHRALRKGYPEAVFCQGKTIDQIKGIIDKLSETNESLIATRAEMNVYEALSQVRDDITYCEAARFMMIGKKRKPLTEKEILVVTAGTSDIPVAEEAALTAEAMGNRVSRLFDVGIAGVHRLFGNIDRIFSANVIITAAGMDGALPGLIGGLVDRPVIAVPTSVGYGSSFGGISALLTMLNSCATGVAVVNIDNGFGAGYMAHTINNSD